ncbi:hypothetical protein K490DRAFT_76468 [Saccharata proteae CBS 121410]|uniref:Ribosomal protein L19 n=1 Tax=Saccharata proteae CBS 121410 TaxID=1314787 RepID=A0A9P4HPF5_9PEZI|nr:hypothetical protein K490DRAFT_76468 [Saccharata proteae CBS 121410]
MCRIQVPSLLQSLVPSLLQKLAPCQKLCEPSRYNILLLLGFLGLGFCRGTLLIAFRVDVTGTLGRLVSCHSGSSSSSSGVAGNLMAWRHLFVCPEAPLPGTQLCHVCSRGARRRLFDLEAWLYFLTVHDVKVVVELALLLVTECREAHGIGDVGVVTQVHVVRVVHVRGTDANDYAPDLANLRNATFILPRTGERVRRAFTLRGPSNDAEEEDPDDSTPLLGSPSGTHRGRLASIWDGTKDKGRSAYAFATSKTGQGMLKCSLAYLLGSMATFVPPIAAFLGKNDGKHMVATITVYFHPARSAGSMIEATMLALMAFAYAAFVSFTSQAVSIFFRRIDLLIVGHAIVLIVFCGGGLGFVGWLKQKLGNPLVNVACSLTSLAIITVLTKEGAVQAATFSYDKVFQVMKMVIMGIIATTAVNLLIKPISARKELREDLRKTTDLLGDQLTMITRSFLSGSEEELKHPAYVAISDKYKSTFNSLLKNLAEAKKEHLLLGTEKEYRIEARLVRCLERLSQNIGGLRGAAQTQFALIAKQPSGGVPTPMTASSRVPSQISLFSPESVQGGFGGLAAIDEATEDESPQEESQPASTLPSGVQTAETPGDIFTVFITHLGPSMKSLAYTLKVVLDDLPFGPGPDFLISVNSNFRSSLVSANILFTQSRKEALAAVYNKRVPSKSKPVEVLADYEEVAASCGYFSSSLQDFAEDMLVYLDILDELKLELDKSPRARSWNWLLFWRKQTKDERPVTPDLTEANAERGLSHGVPDPVRSQSVIAEHSEKSTKSESWTFRLWETFAFLRREDIKFAVKIGIGAILYAMWSFIPETRPFYSHWRGEWGLLSYMLVCAMTIGASNTTGYQRFLGTCMGAVLAIVAWIACDENPFILAFFGWLISLGCFYIIIGKGKGPMGRFILLTYNLSALYAYSLSVKDEEDDDDEGGISPEIWEIVLHRVVAVMVGCIWGIVVTRVIWPISARRKIKDGLCVLWLRMGLIWKRDPLAMILLGSPEVSYMDIRESTQLQRFLDYLETLRKAAVSEFELRGRFPDKIYERMLKTTGNMLDAFHAMNVVITKDLKATPGEAALLRYTRPERFQLALRISHLFSVLASSMKLEYPLNDALPNIEHTRDRLLAKIFDFRKNGDPDGVATDEDYELLYAYALVTLQLAQDILKLGQDIEQLYGVLNEENLKLEVNLRTQKRLASAVVGCGKRKIWLDPNESNEISNANSRQTIRKLVSDGLIIKKPVTMHSRARARELTAARRIGRHRGFGKRKGTKDARMPSQVLWMRRLRVLRRLLVKYRASGKIDKHLYHELYHLSKGNTFKHKRALVEHVRFPDDIMTRFMSLTMSKQIHKAKAEKQRERILKEEMDAKRAKTKAARERRQERVDAKRLQLAADDEEKKA